MSFDAAPKYVIKSQANTRQDMNVNAQFAFLFGFDQMTVVVAMRQAIAVSSASIVGCL